MTQVTVNMVIIAEKCTINMSATFRIVRKVVSQDIQNLARMDKIADSFPKKLLLLLMMKKTMISRNN